MTLATPSLRQSPDFAVRNPFDGTTLATGQAADRQEQGSQEQKEQSIL